MANDNVLTISVKVNPLMELDKKKLALLTVKDVGYKVPKPFDFKESFMPTSSKWNEKKLAAAMVDVCRYDSGLFGVQLMEVYGKIGDAKNGQDKMKATKEFIKKSASLLKSARDRMAERISDLQEEVSGEAKFNQKALEGASKALDTKAFDGLKKLGRDSSADMMQHMDACKDEIEDAQKADAKDAIKRDKELKKSLMSADDASKKELNKEEAAAAAEAESDLADKIARILKASTASFKSKCTAYSDAVQASKGEVADVIKGFAGTLKNGIAESEMADAKKSVKLLKSALDGLGGALKIQIGEHIKAQSLLAAGKPGDAKKHVVVEGGPVDKAALIVQAELDKMAAKYKKKAKDAKV